jgi:hypothetical protein
MNLDQVFGPAAGVIGRVVDDEAVIVLPGEGKVKVLNEVGAFIWSQIDGIRTISEIVNLVCDEYDVDQPQAQTDTITFLTDLQQRGVIVLVE